jgi:hypothetical protein
MTHLARPFSLVVLVLALAAQAPPAAASNTWSDTDPVVLITTPGGHQVAVYVDNGTSPAEHLTAAQLAQMSYTVKSLASGATTAVTLTSTVPCDAPGASYATRAIASTGAFATGSVYGQDYGTCGQPMTIKFTLPLG